MKESKISPTALKVEDDSKTQQDSPSEAPQTDQQPPAAQSSTNASSQYVDKSSQNQYIGMNINMNMNMNFQSGVQQPPPVAVSDEQQRQMQQQFIHHQMQQTQIAQLQRFNQNFGNNSAGDLSVAGQFVAGANQIANSLGGAFSQGSQSFNNMGMPMNQESQFHSQGQNVQSHGLGGFNQNNMGNLQFQNNQNGMFMNGQNMQGSSQNQFGSLIGNSQNYDQNQSNPFQAPSNDYSQNMAQQQNQFQPQNDSGRGSRYQATNQGMPGQMPPYGMGNEQFPGARNSQANQFSQGNSGYNSTQQPNVFQGMNSQFQSQNQNTQSRSRIMSGQDQQTRYIPAPLSQINQRVNQVNPNQAQTQNPQGSINFDGFQGQNQWANSNQYGGVNSQNQNMVDMTLQKQNTDDIGTTEAQAQELFIQQQISAPVKSPNKIFDVKQSASISKFEESQKEDNSHSSPKKQSPSQRWDDEDHSSSAWEESKGQEMSSDQQSSSLASQHQSDPHSQQQHMNQRGGNGSQGIIQPIFVQQLSINQLQQMSHLNYLKESVPCIEYEYGFCMDGAKDCMFLHQKSTDRLPQYKPNECLPKEYLDKVKNYFDDSQITNVNMIQNLMKQMSQQLTQNQNIGGNQYGPNDGGADAFDLNSLLGGMRGGGYNGGYSNTDTLTLNSYQNPNKYNPMGPKSPMALQNHTNQFGQNPISLNQSQSSKHSMKPSGNRDKGNNKQGQQPNIENSRLETFQSATHGIEPISAALEPVAGNAGAHPYDNHLDKTLNSNYQNISLSDVFSEQNDKYSFSQDTLSQQPQSSTLFDSNSSMLKYKKMEFPEITETMNQIENVFEGRSRYFIIKSSTIENLNVSLQNGAWATTSGPSRKLCYALKSVENVILIFSVNESSCFQGIARMESEPDQTLKPDIFKGNADGYNGQLNFMPNFKIKWIQRCVFPFREILFLPGNPLNENQPVFKSFNSQEIPYKLGNFLCHLLLNDGVPKNAIPTEQIPKNLESLTKKEKQELEVKELNKQLLQDPYRRVFHCLSSHMEPLDFQYDFNENQSQYQLNRYTRRQNNHNKHDSSFQSSNNRDYYYSGNQYHNQSYGSNQGHYQNNQSYYQSSNQNSYSNDQGYSYSKSNQNNNGGDYSEYSNSGGSNQGGQKKGSRNQNSQYQSTQGQGYHGGGNAKYSRKNNNQYATKKK